MRVSLTETFPLATHTTLGVGGFAEYYTKVSTDEELCTAIAWANEQKKPVTILGGGSNVLVDDAGVRGLVLQLNYTSISYAKVSEDVTFVTVGAGVVLDRLIAELVERQLWGLENLSAIPGTVGAVPIQNVGAYGIEAKDLIETVTAYDIQTHSFVVLTNAECGFAYRDSVFKRDSRTRYVITAVTFRVTPEPLPQITYRDLAVYFESNPTPKIQEVRNAIISIRSNKFPDWNTIGTAGSFFKNPIITAEAFKKLQSQYPGVPGYTQENGYVKVALGWILDHVCHVRGYQEGNIGLYEAQALVLVCTKDATAQEIKNFSQKIIDLVFQKTGIQIEREVTILT